MRIWDKCLPPTEDKQTHGQTAETAEGQVLQEEPWSLMTFSCRPGVDKPESLAQRWRLWDASSPHHSIWLYAAFSSSFLLRYTRGGSCDSASTCGKVSLAGSKLGLIFLKSTFLYILPKNWNIRTVNIHTIAHPNLLNGCITICSEFKGLLAIIRREEEYVYFA